MANIQEMSARGEHISQEDMVHIIYSIANGNIDRDDNEAAVVFDHCENH